MNIAKNVIILSFATLLLLFLSSCEQEQVVEEWELGAPAGMFENFSHEELNSFKENGIKYIELGSGTVSGKTDKEVKRWVSEFKKKVDEAGIEVWSIHLPFSNELDISIADDNDRNHTIETHKRIMKLLEPLNIDKFIIHPSAEPIVDEERIKRMKNSIASLKILTEEVKKYNAQLALEVLPRTCLGNTSEEILKIVRAVGNNLGVCFDTNHLLKEKPEEFVAEVGDLITTVHVSDYDGTDEKHWLPGSEGGIINWNNVIRELVNVGYQGPWMYEVSKGGGRDRNENYSAVDLARNWNNLKSGFKNNR